MRKATSPIALPASFMLWPGVSGDGETKNANTSLKSVHAYEGYSQLKKRCLNENDRAFLGTRMARSTAAGSCTLPPLPQVNVFGKPGASSPADEVYEAELVPLPLPSHDLAASKPVWFLALAMPDDIARTRAPSKGFVLSPNDGRKPICIDGSVPCMIGVMSKGPPAAANVAPITPHRSPPLPVG